MSPLSGHVLRALLPAALGVLGLALIVALADARAQMGHQDNLIAELNVGISDLQNARAAIQDDVRRLAEERKALLESQDELRGEMEEARAERDLVKVERDRLQSEHDRLQVERDRLRSERDRLQAEGDALRGRLAIPTPTPTVGLGEARTAALAKVLDLDDQIESEFSTFMGHLEVVVNSFNRGNLIAAQAGHARASESADRLKALFRARNETAKPLR